MPHPYDDAVYRLAGRIPPGNVLAYGDIAELLGAGGPRQVGAAMSRSAGRRLPWWRVVGADGTLPTDLHERALQHWAAEAIPLSRGKVRIIEARWQPDAAGFAFLDGLAAELSGHPGGAGADPNRQGQVF